MVGASPWERLRHDHHAGRCPMIRIAVVDYGSGNLASASRALTVAADRIVLPGQGAFADCARGLRAVTGMWDAIDRATMAGAPFLGICVGMQLMATRGLEHAVTPGYGWIKGDVAEMEAAGLRLPQMGWNGLDFEPGGHPLLQGLHPGEHAEF